jgi:hypothetical protein
MSPTAAAERSRNFRPLQGDALLSAWERGDRKTWSARGLTLLLAGYPDLAGPDAGAISLAERDRLLLELRRLSFGDTLAAFAFCQECGERLQFELPHATALSALEAGIRAAGMVTVEGWALTLRLAGTADIDDAAADPDIDAARTILLERCVTAACANGTAVPYRDLPEPVRTVAESKLAALHEAVELAVTLTCPGCATSQQVLVDVSSQLWAETRHAARRLLAEVHELAHAHGWSEAAILAMSPPRRRAYLEMLRA